MKKITIRQIVSGKYKLQSELDIANIEYVDSVDLNVVDGKKIVKIHLGLLDYFFNRSLKDALKLIIENDFVGQNIKFEFAI